MYCKLFTLQIIGNLFNLEVVSNIIVVQSDSGYLRASLVQRKQCRILYSNKKSNLELVFTEFNNI